MIQYKCDMCGKEALNKENVLIIDNFPRKVCQHVTGGTGAELLAPFNIIKNVEIHLCFSCCTKIANMFPIIDSEID